MIIIKIYGIILFGLINLLDIFKIIINDNFDDRLENLIEFLLLLPILIYLILS